MKKQLSAAWKNSSKYKSVSLSKLLHNRFLVEVFYDESVNQKIVGVTDGFGDEPNCLRGIGTS